MRSFALCLLLLASACESTNGAFCDGANPCSGGQVCNLATNQCAASNADLGAPDLSGGGGDGDVDMTTSCASQCTGTTPICQGGTCVGCGSATPDGETACAALAATAPHCNADGRCVNCRDANDCSDVAKRICDTTTKVCRGCTADADCASLVCDLTPGSGTLGQCITGVIYADADNGNDANSGLTPATAVAKVGVAVMKAGTNSFGVVHLANTTNNQYSAENLSLNNVTITLVGETGATIKPSGANNPALEVKGTSTIVVRNLIFTNGQGAKGDGITCTIATGSLTVLQSTMNGNAAWGLDANGCKLVVADRSIVKANAVGGVFVSDGYKITNSFLVGNAGPGMQLNSPNTAAVRDFNSNTVADNTVTAGSSAGVNCLSTSNPTLVNNILYNNKTTALVSETTCANSYACTDGLDAAAANNVSLVATAPSFVSASDYHLLAASPCKNKGAPTGISDHDIDGQPRPDPISTMSDIGADEVQ